MRIILCDWCRVECPDKTLGAYFDVSIEDSATGEEKVYELCSKCTSKIHALAPAGIGLCQDQCCPAYGVYNHAKHDV